MLLWIIGQVFGPLAMLTGLEQTVMALLLPVGLVANAAVAPWLQGEVLRSLHYLAMILIGCGVGLSVYGSSVAGSDVEVAGSVWTQKSGDAFAYLTSTPIVLLLVVNAVLFLCTAGIPIYTLAAFDRIPINAQLAQLLLPCGSACLAAMAVSCMRTLVEHIKFGWHGSFATSNVEPVFAGAALTGTVGFGVAQVMTLNYALYLFPAIVEVPAYVAFDVSLQCLFGMIIFQEWSIYESSVQAKLCLLCGYVLSLGGIVALYFTGQPDMDLQEREVLLQNHEPNQVSMLKSPPHWSLKQRAQMSGQYA